MVSYLSLYSQKLSSALVGMALLLSVIAARPVLADNSPTPAAAAISPSTILADPSSYEGKPVTVAGKVASFESQKMGSATVTAFQLCDAKCVQVIDQTGASQYADGDQATASGTFHATMKGPRLTFNNVILITRTK